jgi:hypothetical protein
VQLERAPQHDLELLDVDRLDEEVVGALVDRAQRVRALLAPRDHDHLGGGVREAQRFERREALLDAGRVRRQPEVERDHRGLIVARARERFLAVACEADLELVGERPSHLTAKVRVVVDHQQPGLCDHACSNETALRIV